MAKNDGKLNGVFVTLAILAVAFVGFFVFNRGKGKGEINGPGGIGIKVEGEGPAPSQPGVRIKDAEAGRNVIGKDATGKGVEMEKIKASNDIEGINLSSNSPPKR